MTQDYTHDIKLRQDEDETYDIHYDENGDLEVDNTFDINIIMSLFVDARADSSEVAEPLRRRGFWGDRILYPQEFDNLNLGGKLWLVYGRNTDDQLNNAIDYCEKSLKWLKEKNYCKTITVNGAKILDGIIINITFIVEDNSISEFNFKLWENGQVDVISSL